MYAENEVYYDIYLLEYIFKMVESLTQPWHALMLHTDAWLSIFILSSKDDHIHVHVYVILILFG